jgi:hypothetical protein
MVVENISRVVVFFYTLCVIIVFLNNSSISITLATTKTSKSSTFHENDESFF